MKKTLLTFITSFFCSSLFLFGQTGPGGVESFNNLVMWLDASQESFSNGASVTSWTDQSGNGNSVSGASSPPSFQTNQINGLPSIGFDGVAYLESGGFSELSNQDELTWIIVGGGNTGSQNGLFLGTNYSSGNYKFGTRILNGNFQSFLRLTSGSFNILSTSYSGGYHLLTNTWNSSSGDRVSQLDNSTFGSNNTSTSTTTTNTSITLGRNPHNGSGNLNGSIAEVLLYRSFLNGSQRMIINNHLSSKYALAIANDKFAHDGTYGNEVAGIGQESSSDNHTDAQGTSIVRINGADDLDDGEYLMWGHDGASLTSKTSEVPSGFTSGNGTTLDREWRSDETGGDLGTVDITFDLTGISLGPDINQTFLLTDTDGNFGNATTIAPSSINGNLVTFSNVDLSTNTFFTVGNDGDVEECTAVFNGSWSDAGIWFCDGTPPPDSTYNVVIESDVTVSGTQSAFNVEIAGSGSITISSGATFIVKGDINIQNGGSISSDPAGTFIIRREPGNAQTIDDAGGSTMALGNLIVDNEDGVSVNGTGEIGISGGLTLRDGSFDLGTTTLAFISDASGQGHLKPIESGDLSGTSFRVERFMSARAANWNGIASAGINTNIADLDNEIFISGVTGADGYAVSTSGEGFISIWYHDEGVDEYVAVGNVTDAMPIGRGYEAFLADDLVQWNAKAWDFQGNNLNTSTTDISIDHTGTGWNLIGNPFPGFLDFAQISADYPDINGNRFWYYDADSSQYNFRGPNTFIPPGQGVWIIGNSSFNMSLDPSIHLRGDLSTNELFKQEDNHHEHLKVEVKGTGQETVFGSAVFLEKDDQSFSGADIRDIAPLVVPDERAIKISMDYGSRETMVNYINPEENHIEVPLRVESGQKGSFVMNFKGLSKFDEYQCFNLLNVETGEQIELATGASYQFDIEDESEVLVFTLLMSKDDYEDCVAPTSFSDNEIRVFNQGKIVNADFYLDRSASANIQVFNVMGQPVYQNKATVGYSRESIDLNSVDAGVYFVNIRINGQTLTKKVILQ
ncbi:MAG: T9SS type A sorting domain-containing protein [Salibacteraceae bacterium]